MLNSKIDNKPKNTGSPYKHNKANQIRDIYIDTHNINPKFTFSQEIPEELKYKNFWEKLKLCNKTSRDR